MNAFRTSLLCAAFVFGGTLFADSTCRFVATVPDEAPSLLPEGKKFNLVWHDEFNGTRLDDAKWCYRTNFWGKRANWFAMPEDNAVEVKDGFVRLKIVKRADGSFCSPQLQTGGLLWDDLKPASGPGVAWPFAPRQPPKFMHRYGYYECRAKLQAHAGWWTAFWMQAPANGATLDPRRSGIECDILESFTPGEHIVHAFHYNGCGKEYKRFNAQRAPYTPTPEGAFKLGFPIATNEFHTVGLLWEPDGYTVFVDGRQSGHKVGAVGDEAVSHVEQFLLLTTELKGYRQGKGPDPEVAGAYAAGDAFVVDFVRVYEVSGDVSPRECWVWLMNGLHDEGEYAEATNILTRAAAAGYNALVLCSPEGAYWKPEQAPLTKRLAELAQGLGVEIVPHVWSMGYNDGLPYYVPECVETTAARGLRYRSQGKVAVHVPDDVRCGLEGRVVTNDLVIARAEGLKADRTYRLTCRIRTEKLDPKPYYAVRGIIYHGRKLAQELYDFPVKETQDWKEYAWEFNTFETNAVDLSIRRDRQIGGTVYFDAIRLEERPLTRCLSKTAWAKPVVRSAATGRVYEEGKDYAPFPGMKPRPVEEGFGIALLPGGAIAEGEELLVDAHVPAVQGAKQYFACPFAEGLREHHLRIAKAVEGLIHPKRWLLGVDEWRVANRCALCRSKHMTPGQQMGACVAEMMSVIREVNPKAQVCCWSDMISPLGNAGRQPYYCVNGSLADSWKYVPKDLIMVPWQDGKKETLWLMERGFRCLAGGYYDRKDFTADIAWRDACKDNPKFLGMMYTTWGRGYGGYKDLEAYGRMVLDGGEE